MKTTLHGLVALMVGFLVQAAWADEPAKWHDDFSKANEIAKKDNKLMVLNFTGSDWCGWCIRMKKESLLTKEFLDYAGKHFVLVDVDFPNQKKLQPAIRRTNNSLKDKYHVSGFPTFVVVDKEGKEVGRHVGYLAGGPDAFVKKLDGFKNAASKN